MSDDNTTMIFRIDRQLKAAFEDMAASMDLTASQLMRQMIRGSLDQHRRATAQRQLPLAERNLPATPPATAKASSKPKKGQKLAAAKPANWRPQ